jgi:hypothetical protein
MNVCSLGHETLGRLITGMCEKHYTRVRKYGDPHYKKPRADRGVFRAWHNVSKTETCWLWIGAIKESGYGNHGGTGAHRFMYQLLVGPIPPGLQLDHLCRVRNCVNPAHLEPVTPSENVRRERAARRTARAAA